MLEISAHTFVLLMLLSLAIGVGSTLLVVLPIARNARQTNAEFQKQLASMGMMWASVYEFQEHECDRAQRVAADLERRFWTAARLVQGEHKGKLGAIADTMLSEPAASGGPSVGRSRRRGALTGPEEIRIARRGRMEAAAMSMSGTDGTNSQAT